MDDRLEKALEHSNYSITIANQKKNLKNRFQQQLLVHYQSGVFCADQQTISFVTTMYNEGSSLVVLDTKENPIDITNVEEFITKLRTAYTVASREYVEEFNKIKRLRKIDKLMEL